MWGQPPLGCPAEQRSALFRGSQRKTVKLRSTGGCPHPPGRAKPVYPNAATKPRLRPKKGELALAAPDEGVRAYVCRLEVKANLSCQRSGCYVVRPAER
jgi:hypothetical protein